MPKVKTTYRGGAGPIIIKPPGGGRVAEKSKPAPKAPAKKGK